MCLHLSTELEKDYSEQIVTQVSFVTEFPFGRGYLGWLGKVSVVDNVFPAWRKGRAWASLPS